MYSPWNIPIHQQSGPKHEDSNIAVPPCASRKLKSVYSTLASEADVTIYYAFKRQSLTCLRPSHLRVNIFEVIHFTTPHAFCESLKLVGIAGQLPRCCAVTRPEGAGRLFRQLGSWLPGVNHGNHPGTRGTLVPIDFWSPSRSLVLM